MKDQSELAHENKSKAVSNNLSKRPATLLKQLRAVQAMHDAGKALQLQEISEEALQGKFDVPAKNTVQRMFSTANVAITTLAALNTELGLATYAHKTNTVPVVFPFLATSFARGQTATEVNSAIAKANLQLYDYIDLGDVWDAIDTELVTITAPPPGYTQIANFAFKAYMICPFALTPHQEDLLINAVHGQGTAVHQSAKTHNMSANADAYIHDSGANAIFSYQNMGTHRSLPKVKVLQQGNVNAGQHNF